MSRLMEEHLSTTDFVAVGEREENRQNREKVEPVAPPPSRPAEEEAAGPFLPDDFVQDLRGRWDQIQAGFVDDPRTAVKQADELVASAIKRLAESFAEQRNTLESQWSRGDEASTEDLRIAVRKYRSFFQRLLAM